MTPWTVADQAPLSMEFSRQEYWSGLPFPAVGDLPDSGIEPVSPASQADSLLSEPPDRHSTIPYLRKKIKKKKTSSYISSDYSHNILLDDLSR